MLGALIGAGASLLGGAMSSRSAKKRQREQNAYNDPVQMRARMEKAGFNPLLGPDFAGNQMTVAPSGMMGNAIAQAGLTIANGMSEKKQLELEQTKLEQDRERLDKLLQEATIRPKVGGIYAQTQNTQSIKKTGAPLLSGAAAASEPAGFKPQGVSTVEPEKVEESTMVMQSDGMTSSNPDNPVEMEADLWTWWRDGTFFPNTNETLRRNTPEWMHYKGRDALFPSMIDSAREHRKKAQEAFEKNPPKRRKLKGVNPNLNNKVWN